MATGPYDLGPFQTLSAINFGGAGGWEFVYAPTEGNLAVGAWNALRPARSDGMFYVMDFNGGGTNSGVIWLFDGEKIVPGSNFNCPVLEDYNNPGTFGNSVFTHIQSCVVADGSADDGDIWATTSPIGTGAIYVVQWDESAGVWNTIRTNQGDGPGDFSNIFPMAWDNVNKRAYGMFTHIGGAPPPSTVYNWGYVTSAGTIVKEIDDSQRPTAPQGTYTMYTGFYNDALSQHWLLWSTTSGGSPSNHSSEITTPSGSTWAGVSGSGQLTFQFWEACITQETSPRMFGRSLVNFPPNREVKEFASGAWTTLPDSNILEADPPGGFPGSPIWLGDTTYWYARNPVTLKWEFWKFTP